MHGKKIIVWIVRRLGGTTLTPGTTLPLWSAVLLMATGHVAAAGPDSWQDHDSILAAAEARVQEAHAGTSGRINIVANELDPRVRMRACTSPLQTKIPYGNRRATQVTVEVRCDDSKPWKIYVPVRTVVVRKVLVAARPLTRGSILAAGDINLAESDTTRLPRGYITNPDHAVGHELRRAVSAGEPITPSLLETPPLIKRGQRVTLEARTGALTVRVAGTAKSDGILGEVIEFENQSTKRIVQAVVRSPQAAEILLE